MSINNICIKETVEDYKAVIREQAKALKILHKKLKEKDKEIEELNKQVSKLKWLLRQKKGGDI